MFTPLEKQISPWWWVPTLYFAEGVPYFLVNSISVMLFAKMGVANDRLSFFTTLLYFPWFLKGLWSPLVDVVRSKRWWILAMQALLTAACILLALTLPHPDEATMAAKSTPVSMFTITLLLFIVAAFASATHDIAADGYYMLAHNEKSQAAFVGVRSTFYRIASVFGQGILVWIAGTIENHTGNIPLSWQLTLGITAVVLFAATLYHTFALPAVEPTSTGETPSRMRDSFATFFRKPGIGLGIAFLLLYRLSEGFLVKLCQPFLVDSRSRGGLELGTDTVGILYGTIGVVCLLAGGIVGGLFIARHGLKRSLWPMALSLTLPSLVYILLSICQPDNIVLTGTCIGFEQAGYGFGFTAYMMYMIHISEGEYKTSHYAICTAFMALSMMLPGFVAGAIEVAVGYTWFFILANATSICTFIITYFVYRKLPA